MGLFAISAYAVFGLGDCTLADMISKSSLDWDAFEACLQEGGGRVIRSMKIHSRTGETLEVDFSLSMYREQHVLLQLANIDLANRVAREDALLAQLESGRVLLRGLAHEVKNPLGGLRGAAQLLESELPDPELREYTQVIIAEADRLHRLIDRMSGPKSAPVMKQVNVHRVTEHVRQLLEADLPEGVAIGVEYDPSLPDLHADSEWLVQALLNISLNAVHAVQSNGGGTVKFVSKARSNITLNQVRHRLLIELQVCDDGAGIDDEMQERMFFPMVTGRSEGTGLGLPIAQNLVNHHGGMIECESEPGNTVFSVYLPLEQT